MKCHRSLDYYERVWFAFSILVVFASFFGRCCLVSSVTLNFCAKPFLARTFRVATVVCRLHNNSLCCYFVRSHSFRVITFALLPSICLSGCIVLCFVWSDVQTEFKTTKTPPTTTKTASTKQFCWDRGCNVAASLCAVHVICETKSTVNEIHSQCTIYPRRLSLLCERRAQWRVAVWLYSVAMNADAAKDRQLAVPINGHANTRQQREYILQKLECVRVSVCVLRNRILLTSYFSRFALFYTDWMDGLDVPAKKRFFPSNLFGMCRLRQSHTDARSSYYYLVAFNCFDHRFA